MKTKNTGFTLIEVTVVLFLLGILSAIALPSFNNQVTKARETEAQQNMSLVLRGQQKYYQEHGAFAKTWDQLAIGFGPTSNDYTYEVFATKEQGTGLLVNQQNKDLRSYLGGVKMVAIRNEFSFAVARCRAIKQGDKLTSDSLLVGKYQVRCGRRVNPIQ